MRNLKMDDKEIEKIINQWKSYILTGDLEGYRLEIDEEVPKEFAAIALHMDSRTVKAAGEIEEYYEGYKHASSDILTLIAIEISQDDYMKTINVKRTTSYDLKQDELKKHIWG